MRLARILFFAYLFGLVPCFGVQAQKVEILTGADKNEILLYFDTPYTLTPRTTSQDEYKGLIFDKASAMRQNKRISGSFLSEVQVFNITESLYILGVGNPKEMEVEVSASKDLQTYKIVFRKIMPPPTHLEMLMNRTLQTPSAQSTQNAQESDINAQMLNLPKPQNFVQNEPKEINLRNLKNKEQGALDSQNMKNPQANPQVQNRAQQSMTGKNTAQENTLQENMTESTTKEDMAKEATQTAQTAQDSQNIALSFGSNVLELETWRYVAVIGVMVVLLLVLLWVKGFLKPKGSNFASLLAQDNTFAPKGKNLRVSLQKRIDSKNSLVVIEAGNSRYLVLMGEHGNTLLERYNANTASEDVNIQNNLIIEDSQFAKLLEQKEQRLKRLQNDQRI